MKWIVFNICGDTGKTKMWEVVSKEGGDRLGLVKWYPGWRRYCFFPAPNTIFEQDCLRDIAQFCENRTAIHKQIRNRKS